MFKITKGIDAAKGFHITFENGYTVSVQFGPYNYGDHYDCNFRNEAKCEKEGSTKAECAVWARDGKMISYGDWGDTVGGYMTPREVLELMNWAASQKEAP